MSEYHVKISIETGDDKEDMGYLVINAPPRGLGSWQSFGHARSYASSGKWVVGHAIGKSPQDSYYLDQNNQQVLMLASFIPMWDPSLGAEGSGRFIRTLVPLDSQSIAFWVYEKDGRTP
jgi:hypothetical protein